mmetsp:Transcript_33479/g.58657  ORF Transcript_33479/g.58657 Transcript_33479/m.58657 type:complete len:566 (-) Transcript_33479:74-1771(-)|eukprot:CAMPEP_0204909858 /NCGR_PEP_ID=MMETSP1397-20131031/8484_1 /ASSEMBLY_ACC=CAM_ASM_000891 /TAXON_ID=49980 /ORGANISM="Climacostomum Climacostomum virens, Strain Stock W-24" /LENGTH=565 /DNA_ID=CAMNT_0052079803 /DNA_START=871 /DNA_END=2568 /DNA_ORIENTATION=+
MADLSEGQEVEPQENKDDIVEKSPKLRFIRFNEELGNGAYKRVYRGYDSHTGCEIAWNVIKVNGMPASERRRITEEINLIKTLKHPNIIHFISAWVNRAKEEVVFITEIVTGGSLKSYLKRIRYPKLKVIKLWCREILSGLEYLHSQKPNPIVHRDLKCDNIFIMANTGQIRIADLGLSTTMSRSHIASVVGTPEYMAPEVFDERYGPKVDIYAFGMCLLEMCTLTPPYRECHNPASVFRKVMAGIKPQALDLINDENVKEFISICISCIDKRPSASELLEHPFLNLDETDERIHKPVALKTADISPAPNRKTEIIHQPKVLSLSLILQYEGESNQIDFDYKVGEDKPETVAAEMVEALQLESSAINVVTKEIETLVKAKIALNEASGACQDLKIKDLRREGTMFSDVAKSVQQDIRARDADSSACVTCHSKISSINCSFDAQASHIDRGEPFSSSKSSSSHCEESARNSRLSDDSIESADHKHIPSFAGSLRRGNEGNTKSDVEALQRALNAVLGVKCRIDGVFARKTESLVKQFQEKYRLHVDGVVTHEVWDRLMTEQDRLSS